jgi:hypothetical protein
LADLPAEIQLFGGSSLRRDFSPADSIGFSVTLSTVSLANRSLDMSATIATDLSAAIRFL